MNRLCIWIGFYAAILVACLAGIGLAALAIGIPNWQVTAVGCWLLCCYASLCVPDEVWERKLFCKFQK